MFGSLCYPSGPYIVRFTRYRSVNKEVCKGWKLETNEEKILYILFDTKKTGESELVSCVTKIYWLQPSIEWGCTIGKYFRRLLIVSPVGNPKLEVQFCLKGS